MAKDVMKVYKGSIKVTFLYKGKTKIAINDDQIVYLMIESDYNNTHILPIIYLSVSIDNDLYNKITEDSSASKFNINIKKKNVMSKSSVQQKVISENFNYVTSSNSVNYTSILNEGAKKVSGNSKTASNDQSYRTLMIGLVSIKQTNTLRKNFNGIYNNIDTSTLLAIALEGTETIVETPKHNTNYESYYVSPVTTRFQMINALFKRNPFYDTQFRYFMDFDRSYLLSKDGKAVQVAKGTPQNVIIDIKDITDTDAYKEGFTEANGSYVVYINSSDVSIIENNSTEKVTTNIVAVDDDTSGTLSTGIDGNTSEDSDTKVTYVRGNNAKVMRNDIESNNVLVQLIKRNIDTAIFTPNRSITIRNFVGNEKFNGNYVLLSKKEVYKLDAGEFTIACTISLSRVPDNVEAETKEAKKKKSTKKSSSTTTKSTKKNSTTKNTTKKSKATSKTATIKKSSAKASTSTKRSVVISSQDKEAMKIIRRYPSDIIRISKDYNTRLLLRANHLAYEKYKMVVALLKKLGITTKKYKDGKKFLSDVEAAWKKYKKKLAEDKKKKEATNKKNDKTPSTNSIGIVEDSQDILDDEDYIEDDVVDDDDGDLEEFDSSYEMYVYAMDMLERDPTHYLENYTSTTDQTIISINALLEQLGIDVTLYINGTKPIDTFLSDVETAYKQIIRGDDEDMPDDTDDDSGEADTPIDLPDDVDDSDDEE